VRVIVTQDGIEEANQQGVTLDDIDDVLLGKQMIQNVDATTRMVTARASGRLVTLWLAENTDDEWELVTAFESGFSVEVAWNHTFGKDE
jgi:hypothetical protein